eukprot:5380088-Pyramimonas_sp.AAC.1
MWSPSWKTPQLVLFLVSRHPAQSLSEKPVSTPDQRWRRNLWTSLGRPKRYLAILLTSSMPCSRGSCMHFAASFTAYLMSGRSSL